MSSARAHPDDHFFAAQSQRWRGRTTPEILAAWIGGEAHEGQPHPKDRPGLVLTPLGLRLQVPGGQAVYWHPGLSQKRIKEKRPDPLVIALGLAPGQTVVDGTLGLGYDARILARAGARVLALEARAPIAVFTLWGLHGLDPAAARRIAVRCVDHRDWLAAAPTASVDFVYLDPMFPPGHEGTGPDLAPLRRLDRAPRVDANTLHQARRVARVRVVLKLAFGESPLTAPNLPEARTYASHSMRFAIWETRNGART
jgi:hypothetical protein